MKILVSLLVILVSLFSCQKKQKGKKPDDLIPQEKMVEVLTELSLLQGARSYNRSLLEETGLKTETYLWDKYDIDSLQFVRSSNYYAENYRLYENIYDKVKERLEVLKAAYDSIREEHERVRDSLQEFGIDSLKEIKPRVPRDSLKINRDTLESDNLPKIFREKT